MEKETVINRFKEFDTFLENIDQKIEIKCGLKYIEFTNNKISNFEMEYFDDFAKANESAHTIKVVDISDGNIKTERIYTHYALTSFYDIATGFYYIISKTHVIYFQVLFISTKKTKIKPSPKKNLNLFKMKQYQINSNTYNGISLSNVSLYFYYLKGYLIFWGNGEVRQMIEPNK